MFVTRVGKLFQIAIKEIDKDWREVFSLFATKNCLLIIDSASVGFSWFYKKKPDKVFID